MTDRGGENRKEARPDLYESHKGSHCNGCKSKDTEIKRLEGELEAADRVLHWRHDNEWASHKKIIELQSENTRLREALERIVKLPSEADPYDTSSECEEQMEKVAKAALQEGKEKDG